MLKAINFKMDTYLSIIKDSFSGYSQYLAREILNPHWGNYFYWLISISLVFWFLEVVIPWRKNQNKIRKDFWLDSFYMFFNFFLFSLIVYNAIRDINTLFSKLQVTTRKQKRLKGDFFPYWRIIWLPIFKIKTF